MFLIFSVNTLLNLFVPNIPFLYSLKCLKTFGFLTFSGSIEMEHWAKIR